MRLQKVVGEFVGILQAIRVLPAPAYPSNWLGLKALESVQYFQEETKKEEPQKQQEESEVRVKGWKQRVKAMSVKWEEVRLITLDWSGDDTIR